MLLVINDAFGERAQKVDSAIKSVLQACGPPERTLGPRTPG